MNVSSITKMNSWLKFLGKNFRLVVCTTVCAKSEVMLKIVIPKEDSETDDANDMVEIDSRSILGIGSTTFLGFL